MVSMIGKGVKKCKATGERFVDELMHSQLRLHDKYETVCPDKQAIPFCSNETAPDRIESARFQPKRD